MNRIVPFSLLVLLACSGPKTASSGDSETRDAAAAALAGFTDAWNRAAAGDSAAPQAYGSLYWPDAELVDPTGQVWPDQGAIVQMHIDLWSTVFKGSTVQGAVRRARRLSPSLMIADFDLTLTLPRSPPPGMPAVDGVVRARLKHVMEKRGSQWKVLAAQNTFQAGPPPGR